MKGLFLLKHLTLAEHGWIKLHNSHMPNSTQWVLLNCVWALVQFVCRICSVHRWQRKMPDTVLDDHHGISKIRQLRNRWMDCQVGVCKQRCLASSYVVLQATRLLISCNTISQVIHHCSISLMLKWKYPPWAAGHIHWSCYAQRNVRACELVSSNTGVACTAPKSHSSVGLAAQCYFTPSEGPLQPGELTKHVPFSYKGIKQAF